MTRVHRRLMWLRRPRRYIRTQRGRPRVESTRLRHDVSARRRYGSRLPSNCAATSPWRVWTLSPRAACSICWYYAQIVSIWPSFRALYTADDMMQHNATSSAVAEGRATHCVTWNLLNFCTVYSFRDIITYLPKMKEFTEHNSYCSCWQLYFFFTDKISNLCLSLARNPITSSPHLPSSSTTPPDFSSLSYLLLKLKSSRFCRTVLTSNHILILSQLDFSKNVHIS